MLKRIALFVAVIILFVAVIMILGISFPSVATASVSAQVTYFSPASGIYYPGNAVISSLSFKNTGTEKWTFWVGYSVQDKAGQWYDIPSHSVTLNPGQVSAAQSKTWYVSTDSLLTTGLYKVVMAVWKTRPENGGAIRLANAEKADAFQAFNFLDDFTSWNSGMWSKSPRGQYPGGNRGYIDPANVLNPTQSNLRIKFPANTFNGGQLASNARYKYGTYEARIKTPTNLKSVSAFFLYQDMKDSKGNDVSDEITIEILNDGTRRIWFTSFISTKSTNHVEMNLPFDPSSDYHKYRIDYYPNYINFYVDGKSMLSHPWATGVPSNSLKILVNAWFPTWPDKLPNPILYPTVDKYTYIDWIQH